MFCPRLDHFVRLNANGRIGKCGHMTNPKDFESFEQLEQSTWLKDIRGKMELDKWPSECQRCQQTEAHTGESIRTKSIERHKILYPKNSRYLIVGGVLDNICNSACQSCSADLSTKIGSLESKQYKKTNNIGQFRTIPQHRILEIDVNGGEPTASPNYRKLIADAPNNVKIVRMNTNGSRVIPELKGLLDRGIMVIVTLSLDGTGATHDYVRWPILWKNYQETVDEYLRMREKNKLLKLDFWTTVSCLNINDLDNIKKYASSRDINHSYAFLNLPEVYSVRFKNKFTNAAKHLAPTQIGIDVDNSEKLDLYIKKQDYLRKINIRDYLSF